MSKPERAAGDLLEGLTAGDAGAQERVWGLLYDELRRVAHRVKSPAATMQTTALVHELYLRLAGRAGGGWKSRAHFVNTASQAMRQILVDRARRKLTAKRDGGIREGADVAELELPQPARQERSPEEVLAVHRALEEMARTHPRHARLVELRFFAGLTLEEAAAVLEISRATAGRDWNTAKGWLYSELRGTSSGGD